MGAKSAVLFFSFELTAPIFSALSYYRHKNMFKKTWKTFLFSISAIIKEQVVYFRFSSLSLSLFGIVVKTTTEVLEQIHKKSVFDRSIRILYLLVHKVFLHDAWNYRIRENPIQNPGVAAAGRGTHSGKGIESRWW